ncbi:MAG TPA: hypothetical protein VFZ70_02610 [Euzebyales bacterium]
MAEHHELIVDADNGAEIVFVCPEEQCGRRVVVNRTRRDYTVIQTGDFFATHSGAVGPLKIRAQV